MIPCILFEDEHLLVVNKPCGLNTHAPSPYASEGLYEWLRHREPRWSRLAIIHRLDKETSGVLVFSLSERANRELTRQFATRKVEKTYLLLTDRELASRSFLARGELVRAGERYVDRPGAKGALPAETRFQRVEVNGGVDSPGIKLPQISGGGVHLWKAQPLTGRTHQIRVQAAEHGLPILGDSLYGGTAAARLCLHAAEIAFRHPCSGAPVVFSAPADFEADARRALRSAVIEPDLTSAFRLVHGASDGQRGKYVDKLGDYLLLQTEKPAGAAERAEVEPLLKSGVARGAYHKMLTRHVRGVATASSSPKHIAGNLAPAVFPIFENGLSFELSFQEGYSVGLFLDQRDNRRRLLTGHIAAGFDLFPPDAAPKSPPDQSSFEMLNLFAYTCGFSVCAAHAGLHTTSLDLSKKYLDWGRRNFELNQIPLERHDFIYGDVMDWLARFAKKRRKFGLIVLDPPTFSQSRESGVFRVEKDLARLVELSAGLLGPQGVLFTSSNAAGWAPDKFLNTVEAAVEAAGRKISQRHYSPQPPDFPGSREEVPYLKSLWLRVG